MNLFIHLSSKTYMFHSLHSMMLVADSYNGAISVQMTAISSWWDEMRDREPGLKFGTLNLVLFLDLSENWFRHYRTTFLTTGETGGRDAGISTRTGSVAVARTSYASKCGPRSQLPDKNPSSKDMHLPCFCVCRLLKTKIMSLSVWKRIIVVVA